MLPYCWSFRDKSQIIAKKSLNEKKKIVLTFIDVHMAHQKVPKFWSLWVVIDWIFLLLSVKIKLLFNLKEENAD